MKRQFISIVLVALAAAVALGGGQLFAQNLLMNGDLEEPLRDSSDPLLADPVPDFWTLTEGPDSLSAVVGDYSQSGRVDAADYTVWRDKLGQTFKLSNESLPPPAPPGVTPGEVTPEDYDVWKANFGMMGVPEPTNTANLINFGKQSNHSGDQGLWLLSWRGGRKVDHGAPPPTVFADLKQSVAGTPGMTYTMTGWARFEFNSAMGAVNLDGDGMTDPLLPDVERVSDMLGGPSPTDVFFALEFLDAGGNVLDGSLEVELKENGQLNDDQLPNNTLADATWMLHTLTAMAPTNTVNVQVRASMIDGVFNTDKNQSAFVDDFSLTVSMAGSGASVGGVPEPATWVLGLLGMALAGASRRRRESRR